MGGGGTLITIDFGNINDEMIYQLFSVEGNETEALNDMYFELYELIGRDAMLKLYKFYKGDKIDLPMKLYRLVLFIANIAKQVPDRRERAKTARAAGYSAKAIEGMLTKRKNETETE